MKVFEKTRSKAMLGGEDRARLPDPCQPSLIGVEALKEIAACLPPVRKHARIECCRFEATNTRFALPEIIIN